MSSRHPEAAADVAAGEGVCVQASTLGSLEALLTFLQSDAVQIPVSGINIGPVHKRDVMRASVMLEKARCMLVQLPAASMVGHCRYRAAACPATTPTDLQLWRAQTKHPSLLQHHRF